VTSDIFFNVSFFAFELHRTWQVEWFAFMFTGFTIRDLGLLVTYCPLSINLQIKIYFIYIHFKGCTARVGGWWMVDGGWWMVDGGW
jgi:hypothetical protein